MAQHLLHTSVMAHFLPDCTCTCVVSMSLWQMRFDISWANWFWVTSMHRTYRETDRQTDRQTNEMQWITRYHNNEMRDINRFITQTENRKKLTTRTRVVPPRIASDRQTRMPAHTDSTLTSWCEKLSYSWAENHTVCRFRFWLSFLWTAAVSEWALERRFSAMKMILKMTSCKQ